MRNSNTLMMKAIKDYNRVYKNLEIDHITRLEGSGKGNRYSYIVFEITAVDKEGNIITDNIYVKG